MFFEITFRGKQTVMGKYEDRQVFVSLLMSSFACTLLTELDSEGEQGAL